MKKKSRTISTHDNGIRKNNRNLPIKDSNWNPGRAKLVLTKREKIVMRKKEKKRERKLRKNSLSSSLPNRLK